MKDKFESITAYSETEQLDILKAICAKIYIARNITLDSKTIVMCLESIDRLFNDDENYN